MGASIINRWIQPIQVTDKTNPRTVNVERLAGNTIAIHDNDCVYLHMSPASMSTDLIVQYLNERIGYTPFGDHRHSVSMEIIAFDDCAVTFAFEWTLCGNSFAQTREV